MTKRNENASKANKGPVSTLTYETGILSNDVKKFILELVKASKGHLELNITIQNNFNVDTPAINKSNITGTINGEINTSLGAGISPQ